MQISPMTRTVARRAASGLAYRGLGAVLTILSILITTAVAAGTVVMGRVPASAPLGLICAAVLAAVGAAEASRPARRERVRRRAD
jgi:hypothetical protein